MGSGILDPGNTSKILVTGATGFVGTAVVHALGEAGYPARILARTPQAARKLGLVAGRDVEVAFGDVTEPASIQAAMRGVAGVIHLVGIISQGGKSTFENIHVAGTRNVVAAAQAAGVERLVHMSALGTRPHAASRYHQTKWLAEEAVRASPLPHTIFRPSLIYGARDHFVNLFAKMARLSPVMPVLGAGQTRLQPVAVAVVAQAFVRALSTPDSLGKTLDLCGPEVLSMEGILDTILTVMHRRRLKARIPMGLARIQAALLERFFGWSGKAPPLNRDQLIMLEEGNTGNAEEANALLGLRHPSFREGIAEYLAPASERQTARTTR